MDEPTDTPLWTQSATTLAEQIREGDVTPTDAVDAHLERIQTADDELTAFITVTDEYAKRAAREADETKEGERGPLHGVPVALKDLGSLKASMRHTFGCALFADFEAPRTAAIVSRLEDAGAIIVGKTNTPAFGHAGTTHNELVGTTGSPVDPSLNAGGSSGGSAAAVGAGMVPIATGSDAGGSLRIPAAACGIYAIKPSYGLVPNDSRPNGFGSHRHHSTKGPLARTVTDAATMLEVMAGPHPMDPDSVPIEIDFVSGLEMDASELSIAYTPDLGTFPVRDGVRRQLEEALDALEGAGATVDHVDFDFDCTHEELLEAVETTFSTGVANGMAILESTFGIDVRAHDDQVADSLLEMIDRGTDVPTTDVAKTGLVRTRVFDAVQSVLAEYDLLATATLSRADIARDADVANEWDLALTWPFNWTGHPAASVPAGRTDHGRPVGLQLIGRRYEDQTVLGASAVLERVHPWDAPYTE